MSDVGTIISLTIATYQKFGRSCHAPLKSPSAKPRAIEPETLNPESGRTKVSGPGVGSSPRRGTCDKQVHNRQNQSNLICLLFKLFTPIIICHRVGTSSIRRFFSLSPLRVIRNSRLGATNCQYRQMCTYNLSSLRIHDREESVSRHLRRLCQIVSCIINILAAN